MRLLVVVVLAACGGSSSRAPTRVDPASSDKPTSEGTGAAAESRAAPRAAPVTFPEPPAGPPPTGTWRVTLEFPRLQGRPAGIVADASGVYLAGAVVTADDVRMRRWAVAKLDPKGAVAWSNVTELPRSPAPERIVLVNGSVVVAGQDDSHEGTRMLIVERRETSSGKRTWQRRFTARDAKCLKTECASKDILGGIAARGSSVLYSATVDRPIEHAYGELSLAKGEPTKSSPALSDLRAHDIAGDDSGLYLLQDTLSGAFSVLKVAPDSKPAWQKKIEIDAMRMTLGAGGVVLWGKAIEKRAADTGEVVWTSKLVGDHIEVATDASGVYATVMIDAKPAPYFAIAKLDAGSGAVQWVRRTSEYAENRPSAYIAIDNDSIYLFGYEAEKLFVERRRKSDGALGEVKPIARTIESQGKKK